MPDVVVVGGGPAGSACALALARRGIGVALVERQRFPRRKVCGEYLSGGAVAGLDELGLRERVERVARPLRGIRLVPPQTAALELPFAAPSLACERSVLDALLLDAARDAGVAIVRGHAEDLAMVDDRVRGVVLRGEDGTRQTLAARVVVGADGAGSLVARKLRVAKVSRGPRRFALGGHYRGCGELAAHVEMYVGSGAYFALNPLDDERANVMVVVRDGDLAAWSGAVDAGMRGKAAALGRGHRDFAAAERLGPRVSVGPLAFDVSAVVRAGAVLVGDAAGFLNPFTGQGVFLALRSAREAAEAIAAGFADVARAELLLTRYARARERDFSVRRRLTRIVNLLVDVPPLAQRAVARLSARPDLGATLLGALAGTIAPERALSPLLLGRLLV